MPGRTATQIKSLWYGKLRVKREQCLGLVGRYLRHLSAFPKGVGDPRARAEAYALTLKQLSGGASTATADGTAAAQFTRSCKGEGGGEDLRGAAEGGAGVGGCGEASLGYYVGSQDPAGAAVDWARRGSTSARAALMSGPSLLRRTSQAAAVGAGGGCTALPAAGEATALDPAHGYHGYDDGAAGTFPAGARDSGGPAAARTAGGAAEPGGASGGWRSSVGGLEYLEYPVATAAAQRLGLLGGGGDCGGAGDDGDSR
ncbi:hypothetical protein HYH03_001275 [Edaphochlamys debaryana]|uniref:Uncharacterized protein n=1 Tax=Edaphochlamys debaryana TaxID=47281 RepID=A0A835YF06_9CHLO|nr:hypothetical protein HYH03_001275 [Edaphochlamys debaryana]|eukprot:KAG2500497.1 hypothetical protein HYH03_001275 [Edaphochlamys debaryana]